MAESIIGLDISSRRLLAVEISGATGKRPTLQRIHVQELDEGMARDSEVLHITQVATALRAFWAEAKFRSRRVVLGVGNQRVLVRDHTVPEMPMPELRQALPYLVSDVLPVSVSETILDFLPIEPVVESHPPSMRGLLVAVMKDSVESNVATLIDAKLKVVGVDLSAFAVVRALSGSGELAGTQTLVQISGRTTHIVIVRDGIPQFVRMVSSGGLNVTDAAMEHLGIDVQTAEQLKLRFGLRGGPEPKLASVTEAMRVPLNALFQAIRATNNYYLEHHPESKIDEVILLGRETRMPGMIEVAAQALELRARTGSPTAGLQGLDRVPDDLLAELEPDLAIPIGLALGRR